MNDDFRPLSSFDHAPDVGPSDVDKCRECGRYAPHAFDHAPECSRFEPIEDEPDTADSVTPSAENNPRMVRPSTDGGTAFDKREQSPEVVASEIVAAEVGDDVGVWCGHGDHADLTIYTGEVMSSTYTPHEDDDGGTHALTIAVVGTEVAVRFDRVIESDGTVSTPHAELLDPAYGARLPVTRFELIDE